MDPNPVWLVSLKEELIRTQTGTEGRPGEDTGRRQRIRAREAWEEIFPADALILDFQPPHCLSLQPVVLC